MAWETNASTSSFTTNTAATDTISNRSGQRQGAANEKFSSSGGGFLGTVYTVVGLNTTQIGAMRGAIREYVNKIEGIISGVKATAEASNAFKSADESVETAVATYVDKVKDYCINLTSDLLAFSDKLKDVQNAWEAATGAMAENINTSANATATSEKYTEKFEAEQQG